MPDEANLTQEYWMYFKENWQSMAEKEPTFGHVDIFQTSPKALGNTTAFEINNRYSYFERGVIKDGLFQQEFYA
ncbi:MAG: hypothetical protein HFF44_05015 [Lawsonibacter sp.]|nr:hypothetical protein [Lawsonibacter sp.]